MATQFKSVAWQKTLSLDRQSAPEFNFLKLSRAATLQYPKSNFSTVITDNPINNKSFLHSKKLRQDVRESKTAFLNLVTTNESQAKGHMDTNSQNERRAPTKKISFKIKKTSSIYRRNQNGAKMTTISANKVAELTMKFNEMITDKNTIIEQQKFRKLVKRVNSQKSIDGDCVLLKSSVKTKDYNVKVSRKPSVIKTKPVFNIEDTNIIIVKAKSAAISRRLSVKERTAGEKVCVRAKMGYLEAPQHVEEPLQRPTSLPIVIGGAPSPPPKLSPNGGAVRAAIEIFERRNSVSPTGLKPKVPDKTSALQTLARNQQQKQINSEKSEENKTDFEGNAVQIINIPAVLPQRRCDSMYEMMNSKTVQTLNVAKSDEAISAAIKPNTSFLWRQNQDKSPTIPTIHSSSIETDSSLYDIVDSNVGQTPKVPPRPISLNLTKPPTPPKKVFHRIYEEKIYEELNKDDDDDLISHSYEYCESQKYEQVEHKTDDGYEYCAASPPEENIYETLPVPPLLPRRQQQEPLPPRPPSRSSYSTIQNGENTSNCYESIYNVDSKKEDTESNYESIYGCQIRSTGSNRDSLVSSDQQSNSLYGRASLVCWGDDGNNYNGKATSDFSSSDRSDDWVDVTDNEDYDRNIGIILVRGRPKKTCGWSQQRREQWAKLPKKVVTDPGIDSDSDHHYESLYNTRKEDTHDDDYDSFDSDTESESSSNKVHLTDSGVDIANSQLPEPPNSQQTYVLTRLAARAGKHMRRLRRNWSLTKNDISKSLSRMTKKKSRRTDMDGVGAKRDTERGEATTAAAATTDPEVQSQNVDFPETDEKTKSLTRKGFLNKFRRSMSMNVESASELTTNLGNNKPKSTFYLTEDIDVDGKVDDADANQDSGVSLSPVPRNLKTGLIRPQSPPPPAPVDLRRSKRDKRTTSWYAEVGLFKNADHLPKRPNTFWYAEVGLYQPGSTPSTSSAENSGNNMTLLMKTSDYINQDQCDDYYNIKNGEYYNTSINSFSSTETKKDQMSADIQLRLQDEPLYQFYDAAVLDSVCSDGTSDFDSDSYEEVGNKRNTESRLSSRPSAMELVTPNNNSLSFTRTLWCEIPEVIQSSVLSTLSAHQKKLQEAKFEMITSEASYLNSLNVLNNYFINNLENSEFVTVEESQILFGKVAAVKDCSENLLSDLEKCWQDNILLHGVCDIVQKHAENNFHVYISYCENQILLDDTLKKIRERSGFPEALKKLESSSACQSLTLYSFLMLPMQRVTRWPLLADAVLKRLSPQDAEYLTCQFTLATLNKIVNQCNEGARRKERENEMRKVASQLEFPKNVPPVDIVLENRWLIRSGPVIHMQTRTDETKLTFGKRLIKQPLTLYLFNDLLCITKMKSETLFSIIHYCQRNLIELSSTDALVSLPIKDAQGRHLLFLTILENQNEKTVEFLLSCNSESDKERWIEALTPPKSEDPDETLYECWDCPQVTAIHNYTAIQSDELALSRGDVINVLRKMADGWYHGERIRDGQTGWFPANYTVEIANPHVRSRNLKQRYRLLAFSENYLKTK